jgi:hypothetical protein
VSFRLVAREMMGLAESFAEIEASTYDKALLMLRETGELTVEYLKSETSERRPPYYAGGPWRLAHPGHWADRSETLRDAYRYTVEIAPPKLNMINDDPGGYGALLEKRVGFFVLSGVTDPGGPLEKALQRAMGVVAPDWQWGGYR